MTHCSSRQDVLIKLSKSIFFWSLKLFVSIKTRQVGPLPIIRVQHPIINIFVDHLIHHDVFHLFIAVDLTLCSHPITSIRGLITNRCLRLLTISNIRRHSLCEIQIQFIFLPDHDCSILVANAGLRQILVSIKDS